jgi:hypothetical protein
LQSLQALSNPNDEHGMSLSFLSLMLYLLADFHFSLDFTATEVVSAERTDENSLVFLLYSVL